MELSYPDGSPAEGVTVQIRAELTPKDNIYTTESVSQGGLVVFEIPFIPMSAQHVWLEVGESHSLGAFLSPCLGTSLVDLWPTAPLREFTVFDVEFGGWKPAHPRARWEVKER